MTHEAGLDDVAGAVSRALDIVARQPQWINEPFFHLRSARDPPESCRAVCGVSQWSPAPVPASSALSGVDDVGGHTGPRWLFVAQSGYSNRGGDPFGAPKGRSSTVQGKRPGIFATDVECNLPGGGFAGSQSAHCCRTGACDCQCSPLMLLQAPTPTSTHPSCRHPSMACCASRVVEAGPRGG